MSSAGGESEATIWQRVMRHSPVAIGISRFDTGRFVTVNEAFLRMHGYARREVIGHTSVELGLWHAQAERRRMLQKLLRGHVHHVAYNYRTKSGRVGRAVVTARRMVLDGDRVAAGRQPIPLVSHGMKAPSPKIWKTFFLPYTWHSKIKLFLIRL